MSRAVRKWVEVVKKEGASLPYGSPLARKMFVLGYLKCLESQNQKGEKVL